MADEGSGVGSLAVTPRLVGLSVGRAGEVAALHRVRMVREAPDDPGVMTEIDADGIAATVLSQRPPTGTVLPSGSAIVVTWREDGVGVREPRRPRPDPLVTARMRLVGDEDGAGQRSSSTG